MISKGIGKNLIQGTKREVPTGSRGRAPVGSGSETTEAEDMLITIAIML